MKRSMSPITSPPPTPDSGVDVKNTKQLTGTARTHPNDSERNTEMPYTTGKAKGAAPYGYRGKQH